MTNWIWPAFRVPAPRGPTAREHLDHIRSAAVRAKPTNVKDIGVAVAACLDGKCLQPGNTPQRGMPPRDDDHGAYVLLARLHCGESEWAKCLLALTHGEPPRRRTRSQG